MRLFLFECIYIRLASFELRRLHALVPYVISPDPLYLRRSTLHHIIYFPVSSLFQSLVVKLICSGFFGTCPFLSLLLEINYFCYVLVSRKRKTLLSSSQTVSRVLINHVFSFIRFIRLVSRNESCGPQNQCRNYYSLDPCGLRVCKNGPAPFPGRMSYKATKPGLVFVLYLSMFLLC